MKRMLGLGVALGLALMTTSAVPQAGAALQQAQILSSVPATTTPNVLNGTVRCCAAPQVGQDIVVGGSTTTLVAYAAAVDLQPLKPVCLLNAQTGLVDTNFG